MKLLSIQEAHQRKFKRQEGIKELQYDASGHCVHIGKLSPGCYSCFIPVPFRKNILTGEKCNLNCVYCTSDKKGKIPPKWHFKTKVTLYKNSFFKNYNPTAMSFSGEGEPLLYMNLIRDYMKIFHDIEKLTSHKPWYYLYTNCILADSNILAQLKELGFDEIRFHLGASNFSEKVYNNLRKAVCYFKVITVEIPAWPPHMKKLFEMLSRIEDMGIKHLNIGEIEINPFNYRKISRVLPHAEIYQCFETHLYDGGLVYDIIEEVIRKRYSYSVLDCNCFVKSIQRSNAKSVCRQDINELCAKY